MLGIGASSQPMRQRRIEIVIERGLQKMPSERGVALEHRMRIDLLHERFRRPVVLVADADADRRQIVDEEVDPVIRRHHDENVGPAGAQPPPDLVEGRRQFGAMVARHGLPVAGNDRSMAGRENTDEFSHGRLSPVRRARRARSSRAAAP
jgi:hypothetical protein